MLILFYSITLTLRAIHKTRSTLPPRVSYKQLHLNSKIRIMFIDLEALNFVGPLPNTVTDFWWLVWQERVHIVAMVTNTMEKGQQKCEQYWPDEGTKEYGPFKVTLADQQVFADYTIRQLFVTVSLRNWEYMLQLLWYI